MDKHKKEIQKEMRDAIDHMRNNELVDIRNFMISPDAFRGKDKYLHEMFAVLEVRMEDLRNLYHEYCELEGDENKTSPNRGIRAAIVFLQNHGYDVKERDYNKVNKWVAYKKEGTEPILHGKVLYDYTSCFCVKRKNAYKDMVGLEQIIGFYDSKEECYAVK